MAQAKFQEGNLVETISRKGFNYYSGIVESIEFISDLIIYWIRLPDGSLSDHFEQHLQIKK